MHGRTHVTKQERSLPNDVTLIEVGPRDGFQSEKKIIPTALKADIIHCLGKAGLTTIQVAAFVNPKRVPQMADADRLLPLLPQETGVTYNALVLNKKGLMRAIQAGIPSVEISVSASDTHSKMNTGLSREKAISESVEMISLAKQNRLHVRAGIQCAFGYVYDGDIAPETVLETARLFLSEGVDMLAISDTTGMAIPESVELMIKRLTPITGDLPIVMHLHDTKGMGYVNAATALACGVTHFDTAFSGMGGCPFIPGSAGNISTEKTASMMSEMGIQTGIDINRVVECAERLQSYLSETTKNGGSRTLP